MRNQLKIEVFFSSITFGGSPTRMGMQPVCHACDKALGVKRKDSKIEIQVPPEAMTLIFSVQQAAEELGVSFELVDINHLSVLQRLKRGLLGKALPCMKMLGTFITGSPTKQEIIEQYLKLSERIDH